jgi:hypothetical protein
MPAHAIAAMITEPLFMFQLLSKFPPLHLTALAGTRRDNGALLGVRCPRR